MAETGKATVVAVSGADTAKVMYEVWIINCADDWEPMKFFKSQAKAVAFLSKNYNRGCVMKYKFPHV